MTNTIRLPVLLLALLLLLLTLTSSTYAAPAPTYQVPKSLSPDLRRSALKLLTRLTTRFPRTVDTSELRLLLASSPTRTRQSIKSNVNLAIGRLISSHPRPRSMTSQELETLRIGRALDGLVSKRARKERKRVEALSKFGRREEARRRVRGLVKAAARARKGLKRRLIGAKKVGRWTEGKRDVGKVLVMPLSGKTVKRSEGEGEGVVAGWKGEGRRMVRSVMRKGHMKRAAKEGRREKRAVVDFVEGEEEEMEMEMETDV